MDKNTTFLLLGVGLIAGCLFSMTRRTEALKKARALRNSYRPTSNHGVYLVRITGGPAWAIDEFATYDADSNRIILEGEDFEADTFEFILA